MLARWLLDAGFLPFLQTYLGFLVPRRVLACSVPVLWRPGGPWDDPGTLRSTRKDTLRSRLGFYRFLADLGVPF